MKLLVIGHHIVVKEYQELWLAAAQRFRDIEFEILCPKAFSQQRRLVHAEALSPDLVPVSTLEAPFGRSGRQHLHFYLGLGAALDRIKPDYVYALEESNSLVTVQIASACQKRGIPYCFWTSLNQVRIYREMYGRMNVRRFLFDWCQRYTFRTANGVNATSLDAVEVLRKQGYTGRITCRGIHGVGRMFTEIGKKRIEANRGPSTPLQVGFIGNLTNVKAVDVLIRAYAALPDRSRVQVSIRGTGEMAAEWHALAQELGVNDELLWQETPLPYRDMPAAMSHLDVLVLPSCTRGGVTEKFGRVLIEAMAVGTVAVGSRDGGIPDALAGAGILFEPGDAAELANVLHGLASDAERWRRSQVQGYETVCATYSYDALGVKQIEGLRNDLGFFEVERGHRQR